jgi:malate dehydrogenase
MSVIAIIGAGPLGGALAHKLAGRSRTAEVRLIDPEESVATGKALDILQSGPVENACVRVTAHGSLHAAVGADAIVFADAVSGAEHAGEAGLALVRQLDAAGASAPLVFAGATQRALMQPCIRELHIPAARVLGTAPTALASALRALSGAMLDTSAVEITLQVLGVPPRQTVVAWQEATVSGQPLTAVMGAHEIAALSARIPGLWPPGPYALASAAARVAEALCSGSRRQYSCFVDVGPALSEPTAGASRRGRIVAMPVKLRAGGIERIVAPTLSGQEQTMLETALSIADP